MRDLQATIRDLPMGARRWAIVAAMVAVNALDGFDVLSIAFAAPGIAEEWGVRRDALGVVLAMELVGMGFGSILLGRAADRFGRRPVILACLIVMASGMWLATTATNPVSLAIFRFGTGLGIGGVLATINSVTAEISSDKGRPTAMALMVTGFPLGATVGGAIASILLHEGDWRLVFEFGAIATAALIPVVVMLVPETPDYHVMRGASGALDRVNASLGRMGLPAVTELPPAAQAPGRGNAFEIFRPDLRRTTMLLAAGLSSHMVSVYYLLKWSPKILADLGYAQSEAAGILVAFNVGGIASGLLFGYAVRKFGLKWPTIAALLAGSAGIHIFGLGQESLDGWKMVTLFCGFMTNAAMIGLYSILAKVFPANVRSTGTGFVIGAGRIGAASSPILAGLLFTSVEGLYLVSAIMAMGSVVAALLLLKSNLDERLAD